MWTIPRLYKLIRNWWSYLQKRGKNTWFFVNPIAPDNIKNDGSDNVQRTDKSPESFKTAEN